MPLSGLFAWLILGKTGESEFSSLPWMTHFETLFKSDINNQNQSYALSSLMIQKLLRIHSVLTNIEIITTQYRIIIAWTHVYQLTGSIPIPPQFLTTSLVLHPSSSCNRHTDTPTQTPLHKYSSVMRHLNQPKTKIICRKLSGRFLLYSYISSPISVTSFNSLLCRIDQKDKHTDQWNKTQSPK